VEEMEEKGRRSRWKALRKEDFPEIFFPDGLPSEGPSGEPVDPGPEAGFYERAIYEARLVREKGAGQEPSDEVESLRAGLLARLRRQPGDISMLVRSGEAVSRMLGAKHRTSPDKARKLAESYLDVINAFSDETMAEAWGEDCEQRWGPPSGADNDNSA